jgi:hypothetical protein
VSVCVSQTDQTISTCRSAQRVAVRQGGICLSVCPFVQSVRPPTPSRSTSTSMFAALRLQAEGGPDLGWVDRDVVRNVLCSFPLRTDASPRKHKQVRVNEEIDPELLIRRLKREVVLLKAEIRWGVEHVPKKRHIISTMLAVSKQNSAAPVCLSRCVLVCVFASRPHQPKGLLLLGCCVARTRTGGL